MTVANPERTGGFGSTRWWVKPGYEAVLETHHLDSLEALFQVTGAELLSKPGLGQWRQRLRIQITLDGTPTPCYLKRFLNPPRPARREVRRARTDRPVPTGLVPAGCDRPRSHAGLEWQWAECLSRDGIFCIEPIAFGEELRRNRERRSAILTLGLPGDALERWMLMWKARDAGLTDEGTRGPRVGGTPAADGKLSVIRRVLVDVAAVVSRLHGCGYVHRDLYLSHIFFDPSSLTVPIRLIDLQRVIRPRFFLRRWIVKDLAALNFSTPSELVTRTDRLRWIKQYLGVSKLDRDTKRLTLRVIGKTAAIARHEARRKRALTGKAGGH